MGTRKRGGTVRDGGKLITVIRRQQPSYFGELPYDYLAFAGRLNRFETEQALEGDSDREDMINLCSEQGKKVFGKLPLNQPVRMRLSLEA